MHSIVNQNIYGMIDYLAYHLSILFDEISIFLIFIPTSGQPGVQVIRR
jgi:hypothetical protein